ncbi:MAG: hypothetical protein FIB03_02780 [Anaerolineae bacterium]|nr:hypothetical protein [Anaerolineae bacterium]
MKLSTNRKLIRMFANVLSVLVILALAFPVVGSAYAAPSSPFLGKWRAIDVDGSEMSLAIGGPPAGPFQITWTDDYISYCNGEAGIVRGTASLNENDPNLLEADVHLECFRSGATLDFHVTFRYHPITNTLSIRYWFGQVTIWHRPGGGQAEEPPALGLRVNYGHDWVESFYEAGHTVWVAITDGDGNLKATAELVTEPKDFWGGETGFQTQWSDWIDPDGNSMDNPPDIQPFDWVYGWVDNGASAQVQIGDISGTIDLNADSIEGTVNAPWFSDEVEVDCHSWGAPLLEEILKYDTVLPDGEDTYSCSWADEWNIQPYQDVGVGYSGPDGNWVANAIIPPNPRIVASEAGDWFWVTEFYPGLLDLFIYESADEGATLLWSGQQEAIDLWGITVIEPNVHDLDLVPGNYLVVSDRVNQKSLVLQPISVTVFDTENEIMARFAPPRSDVWAAAGPQDWQERLMMTADSATGAWLADFKIIGFDITEDMREWSYVHVYDEDGDANEGSTPPPGATLIVVANQEGWVDSGIPVSAGQSFMIKAFGLMNPCSDTYPNGADYCIFFTPQGAEGVVPDENEFGDFPGPGLRFMALLGRIDDGEPFYVGAGGTFTAERDGTLWFTPNDNLRTDNQGTYVVLIWLEPMG